jgi:hypothetical protein
MQKIITLNGYKYPENIKSDHQNYAVPSEILTQVQNELMITLSSFHKFCILNNIDYSLSGGSLIGYYCNKNIIPWDDDIDLEIHPKDLHKIIGLYYSGTNIDVDFNNVNFIEHVKLVELQGVKYEMFVNKKNFDNGKRLLFKLRPFNTKSFKNAIGGLDICTVVKRNDTYINGWDLRSLGIHPNHLNQESTQLVTFGSTQCKVLIKEFAHKYLDQKYGKRWIIRNHIALKLNRMSKKPNPNI